MDLNVMPNPRLSARALDDYKIVVAAVKGDQKAYTTLLDRYRYSVYTTLFKMVRDHTEAEDLTMEAFGKAFRKLPTYAPHYAFSTWLFKIAVNNCIDHVRRKRLPVVQAGDTFDESFDLVSLAKSYDRTPEEEMVRQECIEMTRILLSQLGEKYRRMIELRFYDELSYDEIAQEMDVPLGTVKAQLHRAKELMYQMIQQPGALAWFDRTTRFDKKKDNENQPGASKTIQPEIRTFAEFEAMQMALA